MPGVFPDSSSTRNGRGIAMPKKLLNTLKYGSSKTKKKLYLMFGILAAGVVLTVIALILGNLMLGLAAFTVLFIDGLILFNTSFEQKTVSVNRPERQEKTKKGKKAKAEKAEQEEDTPGALEWLSSEKKTKDEAGEEIEENRAVGGNPLVKYDEKKIKKLMVAYKVKKHHVPVMIDMCQAEKIVQSPAYLWNDATYLYFLVLEEEPRLIKSRLSESDTIHIRRGMTARPMEEYLEMNEPSVVSMIFGSLLPKYYKVENSPYRTEYRKNQYSAAPGIWCTSASVKNLLKILPDRFVLEDGKTDGESTYYQEIYIARLLYWDGVYSGQEYKEKVLEILNGLIRAELAESIVMEYLNAMLMKGLIPREYADYVISKRKVK